MAGDYVSSGNNLKSTIMIDGKEYNVHAKTAESATTADSAAVADKVANKLTISIKRGEANPDSLTFDGTSEASTTIEIPTYTLSKDANTITLTGSDGSTTSVVDANTGGDMLKSVYDTTNNGKVDLAENAEKLGGTVAANYALKSELFSKSYNDLTNKPTIPTVNNATLTIQKNGTTVATFTANSNTAATANITVPTKTSELTNDSGFKKITVSTADPSGDGDIWFKY